MLLMCLHQFTEVFEDVKSFRRGKMLEDDLNEMDSSQIELLKDEFSNLIYDEIHKGYMEVAFRRHEGIFSAVRTPLLAALLLRMEISYPEAFMRDMDLTT